jgi:NAD(P)-dependent dehydrogenase (short-subunit alcohol dehydrogenase family)
MAHPAIRAGHWALITGGASGIGLAVAKALAAAGMRLALVDLGAEKLAVAAEAVRAAGAPEALGREVDVRDGDALRALAEELPPVALLMANAGIGPATSIFGPREPWEEVLSVNLGGVIRTVRAFGPKMIAAGGEGAMICTGSKQGITTPPGNPGYNVSKAGVKVFAEALAHELRATEGCRITAHLMIPGFVFTGLTRAAGGVKPAGAWTPEQTAGFMLESLDRGDFYILCPDNDVSREPDEKRIAWAAGDIVENRPALSRWHPDWAERFAAYLKA